MNAFLIEQDNSQNIELVNEKTTLGRLSTNTIQLNHQTVSKNHAIINYIKQQHKYYLTDLNSINGTFINNNKSKLNNLLQNNDRINIGKYNFIFKYQNKYTSTQYIGKINLKDYCFELSDSIEDKPKLINVEHQIKVKDVKQINNIQIKQKFQRSPQSKESNQGRIQFGDLADFLELEESLDYSMENKKQKQQEKLRNTIKNEQPRIKLPNIGKWQVQQQKQVYKRQNQKQFQHKWKQETRLIEQTRMKLQIEKLRQQQQILQKKIKIEKQLHQQERLLGQKERLMQKQIKNKQKQLEEQEQQRKKQQLQKQRILLERIQHQKQQQIKKIVEKQEQIRNTKAIQLRQELQGKKVQLEYQAQSLGKQYQQIYLNMINKMKNNIEKYESSIRQSQHNIEKMQGQIQNLGKNIHKFNHEVGERRKLLSDINGKNKALLLYASHLQDSTENIRNQIKRKKTAEISSNINIKQRVEQYRNLLKLKLQQNKSLQQQIKQIYLQLKMGKHKQEHEYLQTILSNHKTILKLKDQFYEYIKEQKQLSRQWQNQLQENNQSQGRNRVLNYQLERNRKKIKDNYKDYLCNINQERKHMFKALQSVISQEKKNAAKFLIEEMNVIHEQIKQISNNTEQTHNRIKKIIVNSEQLKQSNEILSELLFKGNNNNHHFDNMKEQINQIMVEIHLENQQQNMGMNLQKLESIQQIQYKLQKQMQNNRTINLNKKQSIQNVHIQKLNKNPIFFFAQKLQKKDQQINNLQKSINNFQQLIKQTKSENQKLQKQKKILDNSVQEYKINQIKKAKQYLYP